MDDNFKFKFELLKQEMDSVQKGIHTYGQLQFTIKGWAITLFSGFVIFALDKDMWVILVVGAAVVIFFWFLDASFKGLQKVYLDRAKKIERFLQKVEPAKGERAFENFRVPNTESGFNRLKGWKKAKDFLCTLFLPRLCPLYLVMLAAMVVLIIRELIFF
jgi:hypothetical protein